MLLSAGAYVNAAAVCLLNGCRPSEWNWINRKEFSRRESAEPICDPKTEGKMSLDQRTLRSNRPRTNRSAEFHERQNEPKRNGIPRCAIHRTASSFSRIGPNKN